jgi:penicillin-binding protein 1A
LVVIARVSVVLVLVFAAVGAYATYWLDKNILSTLPADLSEYRRWRPPTACNVYADDGTPIDEFYVERRVWVPLDELDLWTWQAFISAEDRRFMEHQGVDVPGIARAFWVNYQSGSHRQGASTITQQLVKNLMVGKERSYERKLKEAVLAWRLEKELSKRQILELYVNFIALGSGNYGVEAAAQDYFAISARDLDAGQAAMLAGLVPAPSRYSPRSDAEMAARRREIVLGGMVREGYIDAEVAAGFLDDPVLQPRAVREERQVGTAYVTQVRREVRRLLGDQIPFTKGLQVYTPLDIELQETAERAIRQALVDLDAREGRQGALRRIPPEGWDAFLERAGEMRRDRASNQVLKPDTGACFEALVGPAADLGDLRAGPWRLALREDDRRALVRDTAPEAVPKPLVQVTKPGDVLSVCLVEGDSVRLDDRPWAEGAAVVVENATGRILALVGGYEVGLEGFVRATQAKRQPGSSFKPYVYATAMLHGHTQIDTVLDAPISLPGASGPWSPKNYGGGYAGSLPMRRAFAKSLNTVSVRLILESGVADVIRTAKAMGVQTPVRADPTIALGSSEVTPMDQAMGYATIARMGVAAEPVYIDVVKNVDRVTVGRAGEPVVFDGEAVALLPGGPGRRVLPAGVAYELADMMREVVQAGTATRARKEGFDRAGKTGTTNDCIDAWFIGFTPRYTVAIWIGTDGTSSLGEKETGGKAALPAWLQIIDALPHAAGERFPMPPEAVLVQWQGQWVGLPRGQVPASLLSMPRLGREPLPAFLSHRGVVNP